MNWFKSAFSKPKLRSFRLVGFNALSVRTKYDEVISANEAWRAKQYIMWQHIATLIPETLEHDNWKITFPNGMDVLVTEYLP